MLDALKGNVLWVVALLVLAIVGAVTFLAYEHILTGQDALTVYTLVLTGVVGVGTAHVVSQAQQAVTTGPPAGPAAPPSPPTGPVGTNQEGTVI